MVRIEPVLHALMALAIVMTIFGIVLIAPDVSQGYYYLANCTNGGGDYNACDKVDMSTCTNNTDTQQCDTSTECTCQFKGPFCRCD